MSIIIDEDTTEDTKAPERVSDAEALEALRTWAETWHGGEELWQEEENAFNALVDLTELWIAQAR